MKKRLTYEQALHKAAALCTRAEKCSYDIRQKLLSWELTTEESSAIIKTLITQQFIDDARYCAFFIKDKTRFNKWGKIKIRYALQAKKIDELLINKALDTIDSESTLKQLRELLQQKSKNIKYKDNYEKKGKLIRFALSRGFEMHHIQAVLQEIEE